MFFLLRSPLGAAIQAIRDNEEAAESVGVRVARAKRLIFVLAAFGAALAGALWVATAVTFQPKTYFSPQWTAYMIFMALVGGLGTFEGAILGAVVFFAIEAWFGGAGVWYLVGLGATALVFALALPRGVWGWVEDRTALRLLPIGYRVRFGGERRVRAEEAPSRRRRAKPRPVAAADAIVHQREEFDMKIDFIIDGASVGAASGASFARHDPVTGKIATEAAAAGPADVAKVVEAASRAFATWSETGPGERRALLLKAADLMETRVADFAKLMTEEIGATGPWAGFNVHFGGRHAARGGGADDADYRRSDPVRQARRALARGAPARRRRARHRAVERAGHSRRARDRRAARLRQHGDPALLRSRAPARTI